MSDKSSFQYLFDRPVEPLYIPKGEEKVYFDLPENYLTDEYRPIAARIMGRFRNDSQSSVSLKSIAIPNLGDATKLGRQEIFTLFLPAHRKMAADLTRLFMGMRSADDLLSLAAYTRDRVNPQMWVYSLSVALLHRNDTKDIPIPQLNEIFPDMFFKGSIFPRAREVANVAEPSDRIPIEIPRDWTANNSDPEHRVAYWREDVGINLHHWHWHLVYPFDGPEVVVRKDRRGELFYYQHRQIMARYDTERFCNGLDRTRELSNLREAIPEAYFSKLDSSVAGRAWPARTKNMTISDVNRATDGLVISVSAIETYKQRVQEAIRTKMIRTAQGSMVQLTDFEGIDYLGNMIEASTLSPNYAYYGDLHNLGHLSIAFSHDPDHRYLEPFGVMGDSTTAVRDPIFYPWHRFVDNLFAEFKNSLIPYTVAQLNFPGIEVREVGIITPSANPNTINTHWTKSDLDLSRGLDFTPRGTVLARVTHLNHDSFSYVINVQNNQYTNHMGTVRIFIAPTADNYGRVLNFEEQRQYMIEMDKFEHNFVPGYNQINRSSVLSTVTIPFEATFRDLNAGRPSADQVQQLDAFNYCGCGWPQHMLVPKGTTTGYRMTLFVMVTDYEKDKVPQDVPQGCRTGIVFCGLRDRKYPDSKPMGFPFDRKSRYGVTTMSSFLTDNMATADITVRFTDTIKARQPTPQQAFSNNNYRS